MKMITYAADVGLVKRHGLGGLHLARELHVGLAPVLLAVHPDGRHVAPLRGGRKCVCFE